MYAYNISAVEAIHTHTHKHTHTNTHTHTHAGETPLFNAVYNYNISAVEALLTWKADAKVCVCSECQSKCEYVCYVWTLRFFFLVCVKNGCARERASERQDAGGG